MYKCMINNKNQLIVSLTKIMQSDARSIISTNLREAEHVERAGVLDVDTLCTATAIKELVECMSGERSCPCFSREELKYFVAGLAVG